MEFLIVPDIVLLGVFYFLSKMIFFSKNYKMYRYFVFCVKEIRMILFQFVVASNKMAFFRNQAIRIHHNQVWNKIS